MAFTIDTASRLSPNCGSGVEWVNGKPVYTPCTITPLGMLYHSSEGTEASSVPWLSKPYHPVFNPEPVSTNYFITINGIIYQMVADNRRAWHAGRGAWPGVSDGNALLGVELEHKRGGLRYTDVQLDALHWLSKEKIAQYKFPQNKIVAHRWWAPGRKIDPTDWSDADIRAFIADLYQAKPIQHYRVKLVTPVYEVPALDPKRIAWGGQCIISPPMLLDSDDNSHAGFVHWPAAGFVPVTALEPV